MYRGAVFSCISTVCGGKDNAGIIALSENFFYIDEKEVNQSWFNPRAFVFERVRWMENFYGFNYVEFGRITKASTKDYASISMVGKANYQGKSYPIGGLWLFQGNHQTVLFSMSPSASITQRNLAAALKSGDFRRKP